MPELQPDDHEVIQEENDAGTTVPVCITEQKAPLRTQALPRKGGASFSRTLSTTPLRVLAADHRRARAQVVGVVADLAYLIAFTEAAAQDESTMSLWPSRVPFETTATTEVWLRVPATPGTALAVGITTELWAEGR